MTRERIEGCACSAQSLGTTAIRRIGGVGCREPSLNLEKETKNVFVLNFQHLKVDRTDRTKAAKREPDQSTWKAGIGLGHGLNIRPGYSELVAL